MHDTPSAIPGALMSENQAADYLGLSVRSLQSWRVRGGGPRYVKLGRSVRYKPADLDAFIAAHQVSSTSQTAAGGAGQ